MSSWPTSREIAVRRECADRRRQRGHADHSHTLRWIAGLERPQFLTSPITELGFVRITVANALQPNVRTAITALERWKAATKAQLVPDELGTARLPTWANTAAKTTDGHLLALAQAHEAQLATLDRGLPGALLIP